jgi:hypothetical protein
LCAYKEILEDLPPAQPEPLVKESRTLVKDLVEEIETWNRRAGEEE